MTVSIDLGAVEALIRQASDQEIMPRFRNLRPDEIREKSRGDPVTDADVGAERFLTEHLPNTLPGSVVVGEEGVSADRSVLERLNGEAPVWVIDPVDGTDNFRKGDQTFCCMVALVVRHETLAGWIFSPVTEEMAMATRGGGATLNGVPLKTAATDDPAQMRGAIHTRYLPPGIRRAVTPRIERFGSNRQLYCAGHTYLRLAEGSIDVAMFWRTNPWDHAMGVLILEEAGGFTAFADGERYQPDTSERTGLVSVGHKPAWEAVRDILLP